MSDDGYVRYMSGAPGTKLLSVLVLHDRIVIRELVKGKKKERRILFRIGLNREKPR